VFVIPARTWRESRITLSRLSSLQGKIHWIPD